MFFKQGILCWLAICIVRYLWVSSNHRKQEKEFNCTTKAECDKLGEQYGFKVAEHLFDENGKLKDL